MNSSATKNGSVAGLSLIRVVWALVTYQFGGLMLPLFGMVASGWAILITSQFLARLGQTVTDTYRHETEMILSWVVVLMSVVFAIWGGITNVKSLAGRRYPTQIFLLPLPGFPLLILSTFICLGLLFAGFLVTMLPALLLGFHIPWLLLNSCFLAFVSVGIGATWVGHDFRYGVFLFFLLTPVAYILSDLAAAEVLEYQIPVSVCLFAVGMLSLIWTTFLLVQHRSGQIYSWGGLIRIGYRKRSNSDDQRAPSTRGFGRSPTTSLLMFDFKRSTWPTCKRVVALNLLAFASCVFNEMVRFQLSDLIPLICFQVSVISCMLAATGVVIRSMSFLNEMPAFQATLPLSDRRWGLELLLSLILTLVCCWAVFALSMLPTLAYWRYFQQMEWHLTFRPLIMPISIAIVFVNAMLVFLVGRPAFVLLLLLYGVLHIFAAALSSAYESIDLQPVACILLSFVLFGGYFAITIQSWRLGINSNLAQVFFWVMIIVQLFVYERDLVSHMPIGSYWLYGLVVLPGLPFVSAPLAIYYNRHR